MNQTQKKTLIKKRIFLIFISIILLVTISSTIVMAQDNVVTVESSFLNVRVGPGLSYEVMDELNYGDEINVIEESNEWYKIRLGDDRIGWVASWNVSEEDPDAYQNTYARVSNDFANVRLYADVQSDLLGTVYQGTELEVVFAEHDWVQVQYMGSLGWIRGDLLEVYEGSRAPEVTQEDAAGAEDLNIDLAPAQPGVAISEATIVLDAGHGGIDPGAVSDEFMEKDVTLETASRLQQRLQAAGAEVILTRSDDSDVSLSDRAYISNQYGAHAFISIHYDASNEPNQRSGTSTYYYDDNDIALAETLNSYLLSYGLLQNHGVNFGDFQVLRENYQPAILLELGYMNHDLDHSMIYTDHYQKSIVEAIYQGLMDYFS